MYTNPQKGAAVVAATPATAQICGLRSLIMELILSSPFATAEEWTTATQRVYANSSPATLAKWYRNTLRELANREESASVTLATPQQKETIILLLNDVVIERKEKTRVLLCLHRLRFDGAAKVITQLRERIATRSKAAAAKAPVTAPAPVPHVSTSDRAADLADEAREAEFVAVTGLSYADHARL